MEIVERQLLSFCIEALMEVQEEIKDTTVDSLINHAPSGKEDSLYLDVLPENILRLKLIGEYDRHIVLVTEERGEFNFSDVAQAEIVVFSDPTDRSKYLKRYVEAGIRQETIQHGSLYGDLIAADESHELWDTVEEREDQGFSASLSGACCSITIVKRGEVLFSLLLNYVTEEIIVASKDFIGISPTSDLACPQKETNFESWRQVSFVGTRNENRFLTYLGKDYRENLDKTGLLDQTFAPVGKEPGGPMRILYLSDLNKQPPGFIMSNGEKIGEWVGWLAFCRHCEDLVAYSIYPGTFFAKDDVLMTPSPPYSILETQDNSLYVNYEKLRHIGNPSRYREMILVTHRDNRIRARIEANKSRVLFSA